MKGKPEVLKVLNEALNDELGAVVQYIFHAEMCDNWGYKSLGGFTKKRAIEEMKHAEKLIERILFLEGAPGLQSLPAIEAGKDVQDQLTIDLKGEQTPSSATTRESPRAPRLATGAPPTCCWRTA